MSFLFISLLFRQKVSDILQDAGMIARRRGRKPLKEKPVNPFSKIL